MELLIVTSVVAILVVMISPAVSAAIQKGNQTKCMANLRQFGLAFNFYAADNQGRLPPAQNASPPAPGAEHWTQSPNMWAFQYISPKAKELKKTMRCPSDKTVSTRDDYCSYTWASHFIQNWANGEPQNVGGGRYVMLHEVSGKLLMTDCVTYAPFGVDGALVPVASIAKDVVSDRHQNGANVLMGNGSVQWMSKSNIVNNVNLYNIFSIEQ